MDSSLGPKETKFHTNSTCIIRTPLYYGQSTWSERDQIPYKIYLYNTDTSLLRTVHMVRKRPNSIQTLPLYYGHLSITDSPHGSKETKFHTNSTSLIRTPLYYGQSTWSKRNQIPYKLYLYNTDTSVLRTVHMVRKRPNSIQTLPLYYGHLSITDSPHGPKEPNSIQTLPL